MSLLKEFRDFAVRGNVIDLAVAVVIGGAFGKIITSLVANIIMPPLGLLVGRMDFSELAVVLKDAEVGEAGEEIAAVTLNYGAFTQVIIEFTIIAVAIFMVVMLINSLKRQEEAADTPPPPTVTKQEVLLEEIRDLLKKQAEN